MSDTSRDVFLHGTPSVNPTLGPIANASFTRLLVNEDGVLWIAPADAAGNPITSDAITADGVVPSAAATLSLNVAANLRALNAAGNLDRARFLASDADAQAAAQLGLTGAVARAQRFNGATWDRARSLASDTDAQVAAQLGLTGAVARAQYFNGATWDRGRALATDTDAQAAAQLGLAGVVMRPQIYNGATYDRQRAPVSFNGAGATALGATTIVAAVGGQGIRLLGYVIELTVNAAAAAAAILQALIRMNGAGVAAHDFFVPAASVVTGAGNFTTGWIDLGPVGIAAAAGAIEIDLSVALTAGRVRCSIGYIQGVTT